MYLKLQLLNWHYYKVHFLKVYLIFFEICHESVLSLSTFKGPFILLILHYQYIFKIWSTLQVHF